MKKIALIFFMVFSICASGILTGRIINANTINRSAKQKLNQISMGIFKNNGLSGQSLNKWKTLVFELNKKGKCDWDSFIRYIVDRLKQHTDESAEFHKNKLNAISRLKNQVNHHIIYLRKMKARMANPRNRNMKIKLKNILAVSNIRKNLTRLKYSGRKDINHSLSPQVQKSLGGLPDQFPPEGVTSPEELDALLDAWDEELQSIGEDENLTNIDRQNILQKQQQTLQLMTNVSKSLRDSAMKEIREMDG